MKFPTIQKLLLEASKKEKVQADPDFLNPDVSHKELANRYNMDLSSVSKYRRAAGLAPLKRGGPGVIAKLRKDPDIYDKNVMHKTIAARYGINSATVLRIRQRLGVKGFKSSMGPILKNDPDIRNRDITNKELGQRYGIDASRVSIYRKELGIEPRRMSRKEIVAFHKKLKADPHFMNGRVSAVELAAKYDVAPATIKNLRKAAGFKPYTPKWFNDSILKDKLVGHAEVIAKLRTRFPGELDTITLSRVRARRRKLGIEFGHAGPRARQPKEPSEIIDIFDDDDDFLTDEDLSDEEVSIEIGLPLATVFYKRDMLKVKRPPIKKPLGKTSKLVNDPRMLDETLTDKEVAEQMGVRFANVYYIRSRLGVKRPSDSGDIK